MAIGTQAHACCVRLVDLARLSKSPRAAPTWLVLAWQRAPNKAVCFLSLRGEGEVEGVVLKGHASLFGAGGCCLLCEIQYESGCVSLGRGPSLSSLSDSVH